MQIADRVAAQLSLVQRGVFARWQLREAGVSAAAIQRRLRAGTWVRHWQGVYGLPGVGSSYEQRLWIAWLAVGPQSAISHESAAEVRGVPDVVRGLVTLTGPHSGWHRIPDTTVHQLNDLLPEHVSQVNGLPVTTVPRTIVDLAAVVHPARLRHIVEDSTHARLTTISAIGECLASVARRGKPGVVPLTAALDLFGPGRQVTASRLERVTLDLIRASGLPMPIAQYPFPGRRFASGCVDFAYPQAKLIVETDGRRWHTRIQEIARDHERDMEAARHGWQTLRLLYEHVTQDPNGTIDTLAAVLHQRLLLLAS
jgi:hypothetical protein